MTRNGLFWVNRSGPMYLWVIAASISWYNPVFLLIVFFSLGGRACKKKKFFFKVLGGGRFCSNTWTTLHHYGVLPIKRHVDLTRHSFLGTIWIFFCSHCQAILGSYLCLGYCQEVPRAFTCGDYPSRSREDSVDPNPDPSLASCHL